MHKLNSVYFIYFLFNFFIAKIIIRTYPNIYIAIMFKDTSQIQNAI